MAPIRRWKPCRTSRPRCWRCTAETDPRIDAGIPAIEDAMKKNNKIFEKMIYPGAGHAFHNDTGRGLQPGGRRRMRGSACWSGSPSMSRGRGRIANGSPDMARRSKPDRRLKTSCAECQRQRTSMTEVIASPSDPQLIHRICHTCGTQFAAMEKPPSTVRSADDERQYIGMGGQRWTTLASPSGDASQPDQAHRTRVDGHWRRAILRHRATGVTGPVTGRECPLGLHQPDRRSPRSRP